MNKHARRFLQVALAAAPLSLAGCDFDWDLGGIGTLPPGSNAAVTDAPPGPPSLSQDGRYVAFESDRSDLVANDANGKTDVFVKDLLTGAVACASVNGQGVPGNGASRYASLSADGRSVAFVSMATDLVGAQAGGFARVFVRDLAAGRTEHASVDSRGKAASGDSFAPALSADGRVLAFSSLVPDLAEDDPYTNPDVLLRDLGAGRTTLASRTLVGPGGN